MFELSQMDAVTWEQPIDMLYACHGRVKKFCHQLSILPDYLAKNGVNQAVKRDVAQILNYFNIAAPLHHQDEELDFFPLLAQLAPETQSGIDELENQHINLHQNWDRLSIQLVELINEQRQTVDLPLIENFIQGYEMHIPLEETLFALGKEIIPENQLMQIGKNMRKRRQPI